MYSEFVGSGVLTEGVGWPMSFFRRDPTHSPVAKQVSLKAQQEAVNAQVHQRVVGACEQLGIEGATNYTCIEQA